MNLRAVSTFTLCTVTILGVACGDSASERETGPASGSGATSTGGGGAGGESTATGGNGGSVNAALAAEQKLFAAMNADDLDAAETIVGELKAVKEAEPDNDRNTWLLGAGAVWWVAESERIGDGGPPLAAIPLAQNSFQELIDKAAAESSYAKGFLGLFLYDSGFDKDTGLALADESAVEKPLFGAFVQMFVRRLVAADDPLTEEGIQAGYALVEACAGEPLDHDNPDFSAHMSKSTSEGEARFCWGSSRVPHGFEGLWLIFGDMLVKGGRLAPAKTAYENAKLAPGYGNWPHKDEIEARLSIDLAERHAAYSNPDPEQWPVVGKDGHACALCHNETQP